MRFDGDSVTRGAVQYEGGFRPFVLDALPALRDVGPFYEYGYHRGVNGERAVDVDLGAYAERLSTDRPDVIVIAWGENDLGTGVSSADLFAALDALVGTARRMRPSAMVVVLGVIAPGPAFPTYYQHSDEYRRHIDAEAAHWATRADAYVAGGAPEHSEDGVHLTRNGYAAVGAALAEAIRAAM